MGAGNVYNVPAHNIQTVPQRGDPPGEGGIDHTWFARGETPSHTTAIFNSLCKNPS